MSFPNYVTKDHFISYIAEEQREIHKKVTNHLADVLLGKLMRFSAKTEIGIQNFGFGIRIYVNGMYYSIAVNTEIRSVLRARGIPMKSNLFMYLRDLKCIDQMASTIISLFMICDISLDNFENVARLMRFRMETDTL